MIEMQRVADGEQRLVQLRATVARLLVLLDNCDREHPERWHSLVRKQVVEINRQYPTSQL